MLIERTGRARGTYRSLAVGLESYGRTDRAADLHQWLAEVGGRRNRFRSSAEQGRQG